jgi:hypothetical protein
MEQLTLNMKKFHGTPAWASRFSTQENPEPERRENTGRFSLYCLR